MCQDLKTCAQWSWLIVFKVSEAMPLRRKSMPHSSWHHCIKSWTSRYSSLPSVPNEWRISWNSASFCTFHNSFRYAYSTTGPCCLECVSLTSTMGLITNWGDFIVIFAIDRVLSCVRLFSKISASWKGKMAVRTLWYFFDIFLCFHVKKGWFVGELNP